MATPTCSCRTRTVWRSVTGCSTGSRPTSAGRTGEFHRPNSGFPGRSSSGTALRKGVGRGRPPLLSLSLTAPPRSRFRTGAKRHPTEDLAELRILSNERSESNEEGAVRRLRGSRRTVQPPVRKPPGPGDSWATAHHRRRRSPHDIGPVAAVSGPHGVAGQAHVPTLDRDPAERGRR